MGGRAIVRNSKQRAKSTGGIVDHDEHLGNAVEKTDGFRFWGRTIACDGEVNDERRIKIVRSCSINAPWNSGIGILSGRFASSRPKLGRRFQAEDLKSEGAMFGPKIAVWAEGGITFGPGRLRRESHGGFSSWASRPRSVKSECKSSPNTIGTLDEISKTRRRIRLS
ncbi:hypothetical protein ACFX1X_004757 [Malus domestica]